MEMLVTKCFVMVHHIFVLIVWRTADELDLHFLSCTNTRGPHVYILVCMIMYFINVMLSGGMCTMKKDY